MQPRPLQQDGEHVELAPPAVQENVEVEFVDVAGPSAAVQENVEVELADVAGPAAAVQENAEVELADVAGSAAAVQENAEVELADVAGPAAAVREDSGDAEAQLGENIFHDARTWPRYVPDELRVELVRRGPLGFQNKDGPFPANPVTIGA